MASFAEHDAFFDDGEDISTPLDAEADAFFAEASKPDEPADALLDAMKNFVLRHAKQLDAMREHVSATLSEAWAEENDAILINMEPYDTLAAESSVHALVNTENQQLNKVVTVFAHIVREVKSLDQIAQAKFYNPLTHFGHKYSYHALAKKPKAGETTPVLDPNSLESFLPTSMKDFPTLEIEFGGLLPILQDLNNFIQRLYSVARNLVTQLACLYHERQKLYLSTYKSARLDPAFEALGILCRICITIDLIIRDNDQISLAWTQYKKLIKYVRADPSKYNVDPTRLRLLESMLLGLDKIILNGECFESLMSQDFGITQEGGQSNSKALIEGNKVLFDTLTSSVKSMFRKINIAMERGFQPHLPQQQPPKDGKPQTNSSAFGGLISLDYQSKLPVVEMCGLYALMRHLFRTSSKVDKKLFNELWVYQKRVPIVHLTGRAVFFIPEFLSKHAAIEAKHVSAPIGKAILTQRIQWLNDCDEHFFSHIEAFYSFVSLWMVRMQSSIKLTKQTPVHAVLSTRSKLLLAGLHLALSLRHCLMDNLFMHLKLNAPFKQKNLRSIAIGCELLTGICAMVNQRQGMIAEHMALMIGQCTFQLKHALLGQRKAIRPAITAAAQGKQVKKIDDGMLDAYAALTLALQLLDQPMHPNRAQLLQMLILIGFRTRMNNKQADQEAEEIRYQMSKLSQLVEYQTFLSQATNTSFIYWFPNMIPIFLKDLYDNPAQITRIIYLFQSLSMVPSLFTGCSKPIRAMLKQEFVQEVLFHLDNEIVRDLCREIETDLRLHIHSVVLHQQSLRAANPDQRDLTRFLLIKPIVFLGQMVSLADFVAHYLNSTFYNLNTVALHDWRVYAEMRNLCAEKYGINLIEVHLPGSAHYSDSLDILEIMRNIHVFVARYNYNMNMQFFFERAVNQSKHLHCISINHISDSLKVHGLGVMNTTVNFTYQFLIRKFKLLSEFLFDDHIKSRLMKASKFYRDNKQTLQLRFPFDYAEKFNAEIRKLGVNPEDQSTFIDQFRRQITEIGNALGYVRMVRSGGLHHVSSAIAFVPDLTAIADFASMCETEGLSTPCQASAVALNACLKQLYSNLTAGSDYFNLLVTIFLSVLNDQAHAHLQLFYLIVPSLMINHVEQIKNQKEKLGKVQGKAEAAFTDDGFALGIAYILRVLQLDDAFDSLHWFESVEAAMEEKKIFYRDEVQRMSGANAKKEAAKNVKAAVKKGSPTESVTSKHEEELAALNAQYKKYVLLQREFQLLFFSISGARIFFQQQHDSKPQADDESTPSSSSPPPPPETNGTSAPITSSPSIPDAPGLVVSADAPPPPPF